MIDKLIYPIMVSFLIGLGGTIAMMIANAPRWVRVAGLAFAAIGIGVSLFLVFIVMEWPLWIFGILAVYSAISLIIIRKQI